MSNSPNFKRNFIDLYSRNENALRLFIQASIADPELSEEVLQETAMWLWDNVEKGEGKSDFLGWAISVAKFKILAHRRDITREKNKVVFSEDLINELAVTTSEISENLKNQTQRLNECINNIKDDQHKKLLLAVSNGVKVKEIAKLIQKTETAISNIIYRLKEKLTRCMQMDGGQSNG